MQANIDWVDPRSLAPAALIAAFVLIEFIFLLLLLGWSSLALGLPIAIYQGWIALFISAATPFLLARVPALRQPIAPVVYALGLVALVVLSLVVARHFYDFSYDGQTYHQEAVIQLATGWNPLYQTLPSDVNEWNWLTHYAKGPWIAAACVYEMTDHIEDGKAPNLLLIAASFFICLSLLSRIGRLNVLMCVLFSLLLAFNPVSVYQSLSFYVDGQLSSITISLIAILVIQFFEQHVTTRILTSFLIVMLVNTKFTGVPYTLILGSGFVLVVALYGRLQSYRQLIAYSGIAFLLGVSVFGYNPYATNTLKYGHPFYPLFGSNSIDITSKFTPTNFLERNRMERLFLSLFGASGGGPNTTSELKVPFSVSRDELVAFSTPYTLIAGWGPLFGGASLLAALGLLTIAWSPRRDPGRLLPHLAIVLVVLISVMVHGQGWWARYAPQVWLVPVVISVALVQSPARRSGYIGIGLALVLFANCALVGAVYIYFQQKWRNEFTAQLDSISREGRLIDVYFDTMASNRVRLKEAGVPYRTVEKLRSLECEPKGQFIQSIAAFCPVGH